MCRNPRRNGYRTINEVREHNEADAQYDEIGYTHKKLRDIRDKIE